MEGLQKSFADLGIGDELLGAIERCGYPYPSPIQTLAVPPALEGRDVLGAAETGTGKTAAFVWPTLQRIADIPRSKNPHALILTPTRELAVQIYESVERYRGAVDVHAALVVGGLDSKWQQVELQAGSDLIVATPGRLIEHVVGGKVTLEEVRVAVLDEADLMLDMGFFADTRKLLRACLAKEQTLFFSATLHQEVEEWAGNELTNPVRVEAAPAGTLVNTINELHYRVKPTAKPHLLKHILVGEEGSVDAEASVASIHTSKLRKSLVFVNKRALAVGLTKLLADAGIKAGEVHGKRSQQERLEALAAFKNDELDVLVATDVAARGLDIPDVEIVYNLEWPREELEYIHRAGRTARMGKEGLTVSFVSDEELPKLREMQKLTGRTIPEGEIEDFDFGVKFPRVEVYDDNDDGKRRRKDPRRKDSHIPTPKELAQRQQRRARKRNPITDKGEVKIKRGKKKRGGR